MFSKRIKYALGVISLIFSIFSSSIGWAQQSLQLGAHSYARVAAPYLNVPISRMPGFFLAVGGVAFEAVAVGQNGLQVTDLTYYPSRSDGDRLIVTLRDGKGARFSVRAPIYDWQLVPIARFAASDIGSAMTLFGELNDKARQETLTREGGRAINYHPAFDNTLMGLRLMQADMMLFDENAVDLPRYGRQYILGAGEVAPNTQKNLERFLAIQAFLSEEGNSYRSYVTGDLGQSVSFFIQDGIIKFTGRPFWTMWDDPPDVQTAREEIEEYEILGDESPLSPLVAKYGHDKVKLKRAISLDEAKIRDAETNPKVAIKPDLSRRVSEKVASLGGINPTVYSALSTVMYYSALFRHFRNINPTAYGSFVKSLSSVHVTPSVETPTVQSD